MTGGFSTPKKDKALKVSSGQTVKTGQILCRGLDNYKAGLNVKGLNTLYALCPGKVYFSKKKESREKVRTYINIKQDIKVQERIASAKNLSSSK